uniref:Fibrinogen C-terminal domain-containing protein n=1 Tax=Pygocentrus nattereri TaxID=42514 RepID=A0AAR2LVH6_PYGNA
MTRILTAMLLLFVALPLLVQSIPVNKRFLPLDCEDIFNNGSNQSGVYTIYPKGPEKAVQVYCDMGCNEYDSHKDGKWTVIQKRTDGSVNFYRMWEQYKNGFGNLSGEYWLGLETMFLLTYANKYELRVDMEDFEGGSAYAQYSSFSVDSEALRYRLHIKGYINGGAGDCLSYSGERDFATFDKDVYNCADTYSGGFWYGYWPCHLANPNGQYKRGNVGSSYTGVMWGCWRGYYYSLKTIVMKIRRVSLDELEA